MLKEEVLKILFSEDDYISGELISYKLSVSRTAVWKAINKLKTEGYNIDSISNRGYKLNKDTDVLNEFELKQVLADIDINCNYRETVGSTNIWAKYCAEEGEKKTSLYVAAEQTAGRGRRGRSWISEKDAGIFMSLLLRPEFESDKASMITILAALAVARGIEAVTKLKVQIKWPNDILINNKKVCGILTELSMDMDGISYIVCGIGINTNTVSFSKELEGIASSIYLESSKPCIRKNLIKVVVEHFFKLYDDFILKHDLSFIKQEYENRLIHKDRYIYAVGGHRSLRYMSRGIDENGLLCVEDDSGELIKLSGTEISIRGCDNS